MKFIRWSWASRYDFLNGDTFIDNAKRDVEELQRKSARCNAILWMEISIGNERRVKRLV